MNVNAVINKNRLKTWLIMTLFVVFITTLVYVFVKAFGYDISFVWIALGFSTLTSIGSYYFSDKLVLATTGAKPASKEDYPKLHNIVEKLSGDAHLPIPKIYIVKDQSLNAFATGRDPKHAVVAVTSGLLEKLNNVELEGVLSHELSHVKNFDIRVMTIVSVLVGFIALLANIFMRNIFFGSFGGSRDRGGAGTIFLAVGIILAILSPIIATLIQLAISRKREFLADASGALLTRYPEGLASALEKIGKDHVSLRTANNATAHLFIANPFKGKDFLGMTALFMTHPPVDERIKILRSM